MDKYRLIAIQDEMRVIAQKAPAADLGEVWQTIPNRREIYKIKKLEVLKDSFIFHTKASFDFDFGYPVYIKINHRNLIFKLNPEDYKTHQNQLVCSFPKEAKAIESRRYERTNFPDSSNLIVTLRPVSEKTAIDIDVRLLDISLMGLGVQASSLNKDFFQRSSVFKMIKVLGLPYLEKAKFTVCHITLKEDKNLIKIGLSADSFIDQELFRILHNELESKGLIG
jgi:hypothetical protein